MTSLEKLDAVLQTIIDNRFKQHITLELLFKLHEKMGVEFGEVTSLLNKLQKDDYVDVVKTKIPDTESYSSYYTVNFDGLVFNEQGGYMGEVLERQRLTTVENRQQSLNVKVFWLTVVLALSAFVAALWYCTDLYWRFGWFQSRFWWTLGVVVVILAALTSYLIWKLLPSKKQLKE
jgi:hypothetical protein